MAAWLPATVAILGICAVLRGGSQVLLPDWLADCRPSAGLVALSALRPNIQIACELLFLLPAQAILLRALPPAFTAAFAFGHVLNVLLDLAEFLKVFFLFFLSAPFYACIAGIQSKGKASPAQSDPKAGDPSPDLVARRVHLALRHRGLGLRSVAAHAPAA